MRLSSSLAVLLCSVLSLQQVAVHGIPVRTQSELSRRGGCFSCQSANGIANQLANGPVQAGVSSGPMAPRRPANHRGANAIANQLANGPVSHQYPPRPQKPARHRRDNI